MFFFMKNDLPKIYNKIYKTLYNIVKHYMNFPRFNAWKIVLHPTKQPLKNPSLAFT